MPSLRGATAWSHSGNAEDVEANEEELLLDQDDHYGDPDERTDGQMDETLDGQTLLPGAAGAISPDRNRQGTPPREEGNLDEDDALLTRRGRALIVGFLKEHTCYDPLPVSFRLIVLDTALLIKKALAAMVQNGIVSAPLWNSAKHNFAGMLTVSTFVRLFHKYAAHSSPAAALEEIEHLQVQDWQDMERQAGAADPSLLKLHPSESLYEATKLLVNSRSHKLPLVDNDSTSKRELVVSVLTQYRILKYIAANCRQWTSLLRRSLAELQIGTYENLVTATPDTPVLHLISLFVKKSITVVPILDNVQA